jgi:hypothetical protein
MDQTSSESPQPRSGKGWIAGSAVLVVLHGLLAMLRDRNPTRTAAYVIGLFFGGAVVVGLIGLVIYGIVRAIGKTRPASTAAKIVFWILFVFLILNVAQLLGRAVNPRSASAQATFSNEDRQGLRVGADSIRHLRLGFALRNPGTGFIESAEAERGMAAQFGGQLPRKSVATFKVLSDTTVRDGPHSETRYITQHPSGAYFAARCVPSLKPRREYIICAQTFTGEPTGLQVVRNGLTVRND